jgi:hypothetical protein
MKSKADREYLSYLLRLWPVKQNGKVVWRASLEETGSGNKRAFSSLQDLYQFLKIDTAVHNYMEEPK